MVNLSLEPDEQLIISSHAKFGEYRLFGQFKTGDAFLTNKRFLFVGRLEIKTWFHVFSIAAGKGRIHFEIQTSSLKEAKKRRLENTIVVKYVEGSKIRKFLLKPEKTRYLGKVAEMAIGIIGGEIGERVGESISNKMVGLISETIGGQAGGTLGEITGETVQEMKGRKLSKTWLEAFDRVMYQKIPETSKRTDTSCKERGTNGISSTSGSLPYSPAVSRRFFDRIRHFFSVSTHESPRMGIVSLEQIFEEELGRDFGNFEIPLHRVRYLEQLLDTIEDARNPKDREIFSEQLRLYLHQLKEEQSYYKQKHGQ